VEPSMHFFASRQELWVLLSIFLSTFKWYYTIGDLFSVNFIHDFNLRSNVNSVRFKHIFPYAYIDVTLLNPYHDYNMIFKNNFEASISLLFKTVLTNVFNFFIVSIGSFKLF